MKFVASLLLLISTSFFLVGCPSEPKPKAPSGPPPEYEAPRSFDLPKPAGEEPPAAAPTPPVDQPAQPPPAETKPAPTTP